MTGMRRLPLLLLFAALALFTVTGAATKKATAKKATAKKAAVTIAPAAVPHPIAQFLRELSRDGGRQVSFKCTAVGTRFFFEEADGVTVYRFDDGNYMKEEFLRNTTLAKAVKRYAKK